MIGHHEVREIRDEVSNGNINPQEKSSMFTNNRRALKALIDKKKNVEKKGNAMWLDKVSNGKFGYAKVLSTYIVK